MPPVLAFTKYEGLGNDFLLVDVAAEGDLPPEQATSLCDRRFGVGADGVILLLPARTGGCDVRMRVINPDGSVPEMCGNGIRCLALHVARARGLRDARLVVETDAGPRVCDVDDSRGDGMVTVDMGIVRVLGARSLSVRPSGDAPARTVEVTLADAGNPHAVLFGTFSRGDVELLGPRISGHPEFSSGVNVGFALVAQDGIDLVVWERGAGLTLACGTGACAAAAVACAKGLAPRRTPIIVRLPGGTLEVVLADDGRTSMRGPARLVFRGTVGPTDS